MDDYNGFSHNWKPSDENQHPYTYSWYQQLTNYTDNQQHNAEWSESMLKLIDYMIDMMPSYPDADEIIAKIQSNIK
jgi:hypothetical protein